MRADQHVAEYDYTNSKNISKHEMYEEVILYKISIIPIICVI